MSKMPRLVRREKFKEATMNLSKGLSIKYTNKETGVGVQSLQGIKDALEDLGIREVEYV